jgi:hypothetical protein
VKVSPPPLATHNIVREEEEQLTGTQANINIIQKILIGFDDAWVLVTKNAHAQA